MVLAAAGNAIVYVIVTGPLNEPLLMCDCSVTPPPLSAMPLSEPVLFSALFGSGAVILYAVIRAQSARPLRVFILVATLLLLVSVGLPAMMPSPPVEWSAKLTLIAMHVVGYLIIVGVIWLGHKRGWLTNQRIERQSDGS